MTRACRQLVNGGWVAIAMATIWIVFGSFDVSVPAPRLDPAASAAIAIGFVGYR
jgi:hypothetical protein